MESDSIYSKVFVDSINVQADESVWLSDYINEIFMYFLLRMKENVATIHKNGCKKIDVNLFRKGWSVLVATAKTADVHVDNNVVIAYRISNLVLFVYSFFMIIATSLVLPIWIIVTRKKEQYDLSSVNVSVIRAPAAYNKMKFLESTGQVEFYFDDVMRWGAPGPCMYSHGSFIQRILSLLAIPCLVIRDFFLIVYDSIGLVGWGYTGFILFYFYKRVAYKCVFEYFLNLILKKNKHTVYYTGNKEDRFAVLEMRLCKKYGMKSVCIPHGLEYSFRVPAGLAGDEFYCNTSYAQQHLSNLYSNNSKFIYDKKVAEKMFSRGYPIADIDQVVFFPESREPEKNLSILKELVNYGMHIYVKLHIYDSPDNYKEYSDRFTYIDDFDFAISNKICLARKSTVLVEAIYNNSVPIAVLTDAKDRAYVDYMFPSLKDSQINQVYTFEELLKLLDELKHNYNFK